MTFASGRPLQLNYRLLVIIQGLIALGRRFVEPNSSFLGAGRRFSRTGWVPLISPVNKPLPPKGESSSSQLQDVNLNRLTIAL